MLPADRSEAVTRAVRAEVQGIVRARIGGLAEVERELLLLRGICLL